MTNSVEYDSQAADYDETRFTDKVGRHLDMMHKKILMDLIDSPSRRLLEAGVGTGRFGTWLAKKGFDVVGVDLSKQMLKKAKEKKTRLKVDIELIRADVHFLPFKQGVFDGCICINVMDHFPDTDGFLKQVKYVINQEGSFIFNFSNSQSLYLPIALMINSKGQAMFKAGKIQSAWFTFREINDILNRNCFSVKSVKGCFVASPVPFVNIFVKLVRAINIGAENSRLRFFAGSPFVKVKAKNPEMHSG